jgi:hypothetical protein
MYILSEGGRTFRISRFTLEVQSPEVEPEAILQASRFLEPLLQEIIDSFLRRWSPEGSQESIPASSDFDTVRAG